MRRRRVLLLLTALAAVAIAAAAILLPDPQPASASHITAVTVGHHHTCALTNAGGVKCWGENAGQLGDGTTTQRTTPVDVCATGATPPCTSANGNLLSGAAAITAGFDHTCALATGGGVKCWG